MKWDFTYTRQIFISVHSYGTFNTILCIILSNAAYFILDTVEALLLYFSKVDNVYKVHSRKCSQKYLKSHPYSRDRQLFHSFICSIAFWTRTCRFTCQIVQKSCIKLVVVSSYYGGCCLNHCRKGYKIAAQSKKFHLYSWQGFICIGTSLYEIMLEIQDTKSERAIYCKHG